MPFGLTQRRARLSAWVQALFLRLPRQLHVLLQLPDVARAEWHSDAELSCDELGELELGAENLQEHWDAFRLERCRAARGGGGRGGTQESSCLCEVAHREHELGGRVLQVGHAVGRRVAGDGAACVHDEGAHTARVLPERLVLSPAAELAHAKLLAHDVRDLGAGFDVVIEQALGQVKGERCHLTPLVDGQLSRL